MSEQIDIGLNKLLKGALPDYGFESSSNVGNVSREDPLPNPKSHLTFVLGEEVSTTSFVLTSLPSDLNQASEDNNSPLITSDSITINPLALAYRESQWLKLSSLAEEELNSNPQNFQAKCYWSFSAIKLKSLRADLIGFGIISIWQDELENLAEDEKIELKKILIPTTELVSTECVEIDAELGKKLANFLPIKEVILPAEVTKLSEDFIIKNEVKEVVPDNQLDQFQKYLNSLNVPVDSQVTDLADLNSEDTETFQSYKNSNYTNAKKYSSSTIVLLLIFLLLLSSSIYFYAFQQKETPISLVTEPSFVLESTNVLKPKPKMVIKTDAEVKPDPNSPLAKIIDQLENPDPALPAAAKQDLDQLVEPQNVNLAGPVETQELKDLLDGHTPEDTPVAEEAAGPGNQGNNVMDEYLRTTPIVDERVGQARPKPVPFQHYQVRVMQDTSLYNHPSTFEAELMNLYYGDRLLVLEDLGDWLKVDVFGRVIGYVEKNKVR